MSFLDTLNPAQRKAAEITDGPLMVLAGAGSGKTKMLTARMAHLIRDFHVPPYKILAVTFTNKAAGEMAGRVDQLLEGHALGRVEIGTFHSICIRMLRREIEKTPFTKPFVIYDDADQLTLIKQVMRKMDVDPKVVNPKGVQGAINRLKCDGTEPAHMEVRQHHIFDRWVQKIYTQYQTDLFANQALDFGEILCLTYRILRDHEDVRRKYQERFAYVMVDEYQDTNRIQYLWLAQLAGKAAGGHQNLCVVGDEDQSIYKWRGADIRNILEFERDFPGAQTVKLEQNYRSTKNIIEAASHVISHNRERREKHLWTEHPQGEPITIYQLQDDRAEAETVIREILRLTRDQGVTMRDIAVFYRTHAQSRPFEDVLRREKVPYVIVGGLRFYDRKEIKDVLAYFRVLVNPLDEISLLRIINVPGRGIGKTTQEKLSGLGRPLWDVLQDDAALDELFSAGTQKRVKAFTQWILGQQQNLSARRLSELIQVVLDETGYLRELREEATVEAESRIQNLEELSNYINEFEEGAVKQNPQVTGTELLTRFLEQVTLDTQPDMTSAVDALQSGLQLMTVHGSKGLEFPYVFMVGLEEGLFPSVRPWEEQEESEVEEERRLFYVGMTRAEEKLYMSYVKMRRLWGETMLQEPARFLAEIPDAYVQEVRPREALTAASFGGASNGYRSATGGTLSSASGPASSSGMPSVVGQKIHHDDYGPGKIVASEGFGYDQKVTVHFEHAGEKKFLLRYLLKSTGSMA